MWRRQKKIHRSMFLWQLPCFIWKEFVLFSRVQEKGRQGSMLRRKVLDLYCQAFRFSEIQTCILYSRRRLLLLLPLLLLTIQDYYLYMRQEIKFQKLRIDGFRSGASFGGIKIKTSGCNPADRKIFCLICFRYHWLPECCNFTKLGCNFSGPKQLRII